LSLNRHQSLLGSRFEYAKNNSRCGIMDNEQRQQQGSYSNDPTKKQQQGFTPPIQQIGQVSTRFGAAFQEPFTPEDDKKPDYRPKRNGSAKSMALKYTNAEAWRTSRAEARNARIAAKRALRNATIPEPETRTADDAEVVTAAKPRTRKANVGVEKPVSAATAHRPLNAREIAEHDKKQQERTEAERMRLVAEQEAERNKHNARADGMRAATSRREAHILALESALATSATGQQEEIASRREQLAQQIAAHHSQHTPLKEAMTAEDRQAHNLEAEYLRSTVARHTIRLTFLTADAKPDDSHAQRLIRAEQGKLALAHRALAEHIVHSIQSERLLGELTHKPKLQLASLESALARNTRSQEHEIALQRQRLAETRRELAEHCCDAIKQDRLIDELTKRVADQDKRVGELSKPSLEAKRTQAEAQLSRLQRQLNGLLEKVANDAHDADTEQMPTPKLVQQKPKESKLARLWRDAMDTKTAAEEARGKAKEAEVSGDTLRGHLDRKATQMEALAASRAEKYRKEEARVNTPVAKKVITKPKPKPKAKLPANSPEQLVAEVSVAEETASIAEPAAEPAESKPDTSASAAAKPARKRIRYPKKQPAPPRPLPPEVLAEMLPEAQKAQANTLTTSEVCLPPKAEEPASSAITAPTIPQIEPAAPVLPADAGANDLTNQLAAARKAAQAAIKNNDPNALELLRAANALAAQLEQPEPAPAAAPAPNTLVQQVLDILNGKNDAPVESGFAAREMTRRQAEAQRAAEEQAPAKAAKRKAVAEEARREDTRQQDVVGRMRATRAAAGAEETQSPAALSWEEAEKARLAQRAKDDAAKDAARARLEALGIIGKRGPARN
jgi:hypothetical protein